MNIDVFLLFKEQNKWQGGEVQGWKSLSATPGHPPRPAVWEGRWFVFLGEEQGQALTKSGSTRLNRSDRDISSCHLCLPRTGHSWGHHLQGKAFPCATRQSTDERNILTQGWHKKGADNPKKFPATMNKTRKGGN